MAARNLRAVGRNEKPSKPALTVTEAAENGTQRELLVAMRTRVAKAVQSEATQARDLAALTKRLMDIVQEIEAIDARDEAEAGRQSGADESFDADAL